MQKALRCFVCGLKELGEYLVLLKQFCCPECGVAETLNCHSKLYGNDPDSTEGRIQRGQRNVDHQRKTVSDLERDNQDATIATALLGMFEKALAVAGGRLD